jgi:two-component system chemotaxis response regulator CheB
VLWELTNQAPRRFRCHTGHAYTEETLVAMQIQSVEEAIWAAMRALQERKMLMRRLEKEALSSERFEAAAEYTIHAADAERNAEVLHQMILKQAEPAD